MISNAKPKSGSTTALALSSGYLHAFERAVSTEEKHDITFLDQLSNGVIYPNKRRRGVGFLRITAHCSQCHRLDKKRGRYTITLDDAPYDKDMKILQWVAFDVVREQDHQHEIITDRGTCDSSSNHSDSGNSNNSDSGNSNNSDIVNSDSGNGNIIEIDGDKQDDDDNSSSSDEDEPQSSCPIRVVGDKRRAVRKRNYSLIY